MTEAPGPIPSVPPPEPKKSPAFALMLAFVPALLLVATISAFQHGDPPQAVLVVECIFSFICCFVSAFLLIRTKVVWAIVLGLVFVLLNLLVSFFFGCVAALSGTNFH